MIRQFAGARRWVWNNMLEERQKYYDYTGKSLSKTKQMKRLTNMKKVPEMEWLGDMHSQALQQSIRDLDDAYAKFFKEGSGFPNFKSRRSTHQTFRMPQGIKLDGSHVYIPKIGWVKFFKSREVEGELKSLTVKRETDGWFISINTIQEIEVDYPEEIYEDEVLGIDLGFKDFATFSDGRKIENKRDYRGLEHRLAQEQKKLSRKEYGSNNWKKQKRIVDSIHAKIRHKREDRLHKLSRKVADENQAVIFEDLSVAGMKRTNLGKSVGDAGLSKFVRYVEHKMRWQGKYVVKIDRFFPSSKLCRHCHAINEDLKLSDRVWVCTCGAIIFRDKNAAINIKIEGIKILEAGPVGHTASENNKASGGGTSGLDAGLVRVKVLPVNEEPRHEVNHPEGFG